MHVAKQDFVTMFCFKENFLKSGLYIQYTHITRFKGNVYVMWGQILCTLPLSYFCSIYRIYTDKKIILYNKGLFCYVYALQPNHPILAYCDK